jgi:hypothetical protein
LPLARRLVDGLAATGHYLWGGWGSLASLCLFFALREFTAQRLGSLILPTPGEAFATLAGLFSAGVAWPEIATTPTSHRTAESGKAQHGIIRKNTAQCEHRLRNTIQFKYFPGNQTSQYKNDQATAKKSD